MADGVIPFQIPLGEGTEVGGDIPVGDGQGFPVAGVEITDVHAGDLMTGFLQQFNQMGADVTTVARYEDFHPCIFAGLGQPGQNLFRNF